MHYLQTLLRTISHDIRRIDLWRQAAAMAFLTLLGIVPSLAALFTLISFISNYFTETGPVFSFLESFILSNLAQSSGQQVMGLLQGYMRSSNFTQLGLWSFCSLFVALIFLLRQIELTFNHIWQVEVERHFFARFIYFWTIVTLGAFLLSLTWTFGLGLFNNVRGLKEIFASITKGSGGLGNVISLGVLSLFFTALFKLGPNRAVGLRYAAIGGVATGLVLSLARKVFIWYLRDFLLSVSIYGALAALPLFLLWLYTCWVIVLAGGLLAWHLEHGARAPDLLPDLHGGQPFPEGSLSNLHLRSQVPFMVFIKIVRHFRAGSGRGLALAELEKTLPLPRLWLEEALHYLRSKHLIIAANDTEREDQQLAPAPLEYFPARAIDTLSVAEVRHELLDPLGEWLAAWQEQSGEDFVALLAAISQPENSHRTLAELLNA